MPRVSWLIPVRNGARWLGEAVGSALQECGSDDEVVVVDDGSEDGPQDGLPSDRRVVWIEQPPLGIVSALERGRACCQGELIARLDADDRAMPGRLKAQIAALDADPELAVVGGAAQMRCDAGAVPEGMARYVAWVNGLEDVRRALLVESPLFHPAVLMRSAAVDAVGGYRSGDFPEDYDLWLRLAGAGWRLGAVAQEVVELRDRPDRLTRTDPRYRRAAFTSLKMAWVARHLLRDGGKVVVWGGGKTGKPWIRWLLDQGQEIPFVVDLHSGGSRQGIPMVTSDALRDAEVDLLLVAVGVRGARAEIREVLAQLRPDLVEGQDWWPVS